MHKREPIMNVRTDAESAVTGRRASPVDHGFPRSLLWRRLAFALSGLVVVHAGVTQADHLPDCAEAFGESSLAVHSASNGNLNLRENSRVFESTGVNANAGGGSSLNQQAGAVCIADDDPTDTSPGTCDTFGAVTSWEDSGRSFPEPPSNSYANGPNLTVGNGQTVTIDFSGGTPDAYGRITIEDGGHLIIDDTGISGAGEVTVKNSFTGEPGARLTLNGTSVINVDGSFDFGGDKNTDPRSTITVNGVAGDTADIFTNGSIVFEKTDVDVTAGTLRPLGDGKVDFVESDLNCDSTHSAGVQPATEMPECQDTDGGVFVISRATGAIDTTEFRGFFYTDGTQFNIDDSNIQGALTGGGMTVRTSDIVPGDIPTTGDFCEERVADFAFDLGTGEASTCTRREIGVTALDRFGQTLTTYHNEVAISTSSNHGDWFKTDSGGNPGTNGADGTLTDTGTTDDGAAQYQYVDSDDGSISLFLENIHADDLTVTVQDLGTEGTTSTSGTLSFRDNVFVIDSVDTHGSDVVAGRDHTFEATLWQRDASTGDCEVPAAYNDAAQDVRLWIDRHADDPGGAAPPVTAAGTGDTATLGNSDPGSPNLQMDFSGSGATTAGRARFDLSTTDVGKYAFAILEQNSGFAVDVNGSPRAISGGSSDQVVRPFGLFMDLDPDGDGTFDDRAANATCSAQASCAANAGGDVFTIAGTAFPLELTAVLWESADDGDDDGVPDSNQAIADNGATPSFGQEGTAETVDLVHTLVAPAAGDAGTFAGGLGVGGFTGGSTVVTGLSWDEVGIIDLQANLSDNSYLGAADATGTLPNLGRFIPDRLVVGDNDPEFAAAIGAPGGFTYMGQVFTYAVGSEAAITVTAINVNGGTTLNYGGQGTGEDFWKLATPARAYTDATTGISATFTVDQGPGSATWDDGGGTDTRENFDGSATLTISDDELTYDRIDAANLQVPFDAEVDLAFTAAELTDTDNACHDADDDGTCDDFTVDADSGTGGQQPITGTELRFGRLAVASAGGSELAAVFMPVRAEYWSANQAWETNVLDSETALTLATEVDLTNEVGAEGTFTPVDGDQPIALADAPNGGDTQIDSTDPVMLAGGEAQFEFAAPGTAGQTGWAAALPQLLSEHPFLQYDWDTDGIAPDDVLDDNPRARVTFGIFTGDSDWIHFRRQ